MNKVMKNLCKVFGVIWIFIDIIFGIKCLYNIYFNGFEEVFSFLIGGFVLVSITYLFFVVDELIDNDIYIVDKLHEKIE